ncbi:hypothetical protein ACP4OV_011535 [Aristida adscensionis]
MKRPRRDDGSRRAPRPDLARPRRDDGGGATTTAAARRRRWRGAAAASREAAAAASSCVEGSSWLAAPAAPHRRPRRRPRRLRSCPSSPLPPGRPFASSSPSTGAEPPPSSSVRPCSAVFPEHRRRTAVVLLSLARFGSRREKMQFCVPPHRVGRRGRISGRGSERQESKNPGVNSGLRYRRFVGDALTFEGSEAKRRPSSGEEKIGLREPSEKSSRTTVIREKK